VLPGTYTARLTKGGKVYEHKFEIGLDRRATFTVEDRKAQFDAAMRVHKLFGDESALMDRILRLRAALGKSAQAVKDESLRKRIAGVDGRLDDVRKKIVATKEGGAITGEERLREHTDQLYGSLLSYEGRPGAYHLARIDVLQRQLDEITGQLAEVVKGDVAALNGELKTAGLPPIAIP
jgi:hypothetical protein